MSPRLEWAVGGQEEECSEEQYAIEPAPGCDARNHSDDLVTQIEDLPNFVDTARIIRRTVTYGPWEYVPEDELQ